MTYPEIMTRWKHANRRLWPYFVMSILAPFLFVGLLETGLVHWAAPILGLACFWALCGIIYGNLAEELIEVSAWADGFKLQRLVEDLGEHAQDMPLMKIVTNQEDGNFRYPSRLIFVIKGGKKPIVYDWRRHRFARYKWPILPFSIDKAIKRAKLKT